MHALGRLHLCRGTSFRNGGEALRAVGMDGAILVGSTCEIGIESLAHELYLLLISVQRLIAFKMQ